MPKPRGRKRPLLPTGARPLASCLLLACGRPDAISAAVSCFERQDYVNRELLIVDDGGQDLGSLLPAHPVIRYAQLPSGVPVDIKRDYACHLARGDYFVYWEGGDWSGPGRLSAQLAPLLSGKSGVTAIETDLLFATGSGKWYRRDAAARESDQVRINERTLAFHRSLWTGCEAESGVGPIFLERLLGSGARLERVPGDGIYVSVVPGSSLREDWQEICEPDLPAADLAWFSGRAGIRPPHSWRPLLTCVMLTADRVEPALNAVRQFLGQDYANRELLILDYGRDSVASRLPADARISHRKVDAMTIGSLRNLGCREARGDLIAHWDDTDWMAPWRLRRQVEALLDRDAEFCAFNRLLFCQAEPERIWLYEYPPGPRDWLTDGSLVYTKESWLRRPFPESFAPWERPLERGAFISGMESYVAMKPLSDPRREPWSGDIRALLGEAAPFYLKDRKPTPATSTPAKAAPVRRNVTVVIPCREGSNPEVTLHSLARQTMTDFDIVVSQDEGKGANWARNRGFQLVRTPYVLFSDDDIEWLPDGLANLFNALTNHADASYSYGSYEMAGSGVQCALPFDTARLRKGNFISTMSLMRTVDFPGFDESMPRLQDWDLWLTMLAAGKVGIFCGQLIFRTDPKPGITLGNRVPWSDAERMVKEKHGLA